ncbi:SlyX family protein [Kiloniella majae]|uniref:SlyX family protein n=1 Tax=Kiloniella majae TaxID=1938558 RepID=UPI000A278DDE|nr:SlyX family protein [Kiloniella majae]
MEELSERINVLEGYIAEQDKTIQELSDVLADQWQIIEKLSKRLERSERVLEEIIIGQDDSGGASIHLP